MSKIFKTAEVKLLFGYICTTLATTLLIIAFTLKQKYNESVVRTLSASKLGNFF